jgi:hypothetical protein
MTSPQGADYSLTENAISPFQAEPTHLVAAVAERSLRTQATPFQSVEARRCLTGLRRFDTARLDGTLTLVMPLLHMPAPSGELAEKEFLGQACAKAFSRADRKISEDQPDTPIGSGIVKVRERR